MVLLLLYGVTTTISFGVYYLSTKAYNDYLERKGYEFVDGPKTPAELSFTIASYAFKAIIPGYNIYNAVQILWQGNKQFADMAFDDLKSGNIRKLTNEERIEMHNQNHLENATIETQNNHPMQYSELTAEEKIAFLEKQKELLLQGMSQQEEAPKQYTMQQK